MKKIFLLLLSILFSVSVSAQSGRKIQMHPPPPPPEPAVEEPSSAAQPYRQPAAPSGELLVLPQSFLDRRLQSVDNGSLRLADYNDKIIVVNLWATWCGPCRMEIPDYERVRKDYAGRGRVEFIALTTEDPNTSSDRVKKFARNYNFGFRLGWADRQTAVTLMNGKSAIPQTIVIAPGGRIVAHWQGYSPGRSGNRLREAIEDALSESSGLVRRPNERKVDSVANSFRSERKLN